MVQHITLSGLIVLISAAAVVATPVTITDTTPGTATNDGTINSGEYVGASVGMNDGFGNVIGSQSQLHVDSSLAGGLNFGLVRGSGGLNNEAVIYIDSVTGGFTDTTTLNDTDDPLRSAISGNNNQTSASELFFAATFAADYAIAFEEGFGGLWKLTAGGNNSLDFKQSVNLTPNNTSFSSGYEMDLSLSDIGLSPGDSFRYIVTYMNAEDVGGLYRSNEFHGVSASTSLPSADGAGNPGRNNVTLATGDYNTFQSIPEPTSLALAAFAATLVVAARRRSTPA